MTPLLLKSQQNKGARVARSQAGRLETATQPFCTGEVSRAQHWDWHTGVFSSQRSARADSQTVCGKHHMYRFSLFLCFNVFFVFKSIVDLCVSYLTWLTCCLSTHCILHAVNIPTGSVLRRKEGHAHIPECCGNVKLLRAFNFHTYLVVGHF